MNMQMTGIIQGATQCFIEHIGVFRFKKMKTEKLDVNLMLTGNEPLLGTLCSKEFAFCLNDIKKIHKQNKVLTYYNFTEIFKSLNLDLKFYKAYYLLVAF